LISIDGFRPEFYSEHAKILAPRIYGLAHGGVSAPDGMEPIFPTLTYPNHASLVTGVHSSDHGILSNRIGSDWYFNASSIQSTTLWQAEEAAGKKVAILRWPTTLGAHVQWYLPEIFGPGFNSENDWTLIKQNSNPEFLNEVLNSGLLKKITKPSDLDLLAAQAASWVFTHEDPDLTLIHLINVDLVQHQTGTHSAETRAALSGMDRIIGQIISHVDPVHTTVFVVGDHGFADVGRMIYLRALFPEKIFSDQLVIQAEGGQAVIYLKPGAEKSGAKILKILKDHARGFYRILAKEDLEELKAYPKAFCALETMPGSEFSEDESSDFVKNLQTTKGTHGYLPDRPEMQTGFIAWGREVTAGRQVEYVHLVDVAPTVAALLGVYLVTDGKPIKLKDDPKPSASPNP
jgi:predicted AlkP superfamily pyrophosphatase or phosphodiesterase